MKNTVTSTDIFGKTFTVPVSDLSWRPSAYGIVIKDGKLLLVPQFEDNRYDLPGGGLDLGETPEEAVIREVKEETGLEVTDPKIVTVESNFFTFTHSEGNSVQSVMLYYACQFVGGTLSTDGFDDEEKDYAKLAVWLPLDQIDSIEIASSFDWRDAVKKVATHENPRH